MSLDNFLVRPHRRYVEKYSDGEAWTKVDADARHELIEHVAGLPSAVVDDDLAAKQFDLVVFRAELALLRVDPAFSGLRTRITEIASLLEELGNVPMVAAEMALILEAQTDEFWQDITLPMLETVRRRLRALVKLIEYKKRTLVYSDFEDSTGAGSRHLSARHCGRHRHGCVPPQGAGVSQAARKSHRRAQGEAQRAVDGDRSEGAGAYIS